MIGPSIYPDQYKSENDYVMSEDAGSVWIEVGDKVVRVWRTYADPSIVVEIFPAGGEDGPPIAECSV